MNTEIDFRTAVENEETGRYLIFFHPDALGETARIVNNIGGIKMMNNKDDAEFATASAAWEKEDTIVIPSLGVAVCTADPEQMKRMEWGKDVPIRYIRKEFVFNIADQSFSNLEISPEYLRGYQDGTNSLLSRLLNNKGEVSEFEVLNDNSFRDNEGFTWGLQATGIDQSDLSGRGIRVAVLDTGIDFNHPDFKNRQIQSQSFIQGVMTAQDDNGHGTHCIGTLCGPKIPFHGPRYGVAYDAEIFVGKVMKANGKGNEGDILKGIGWAIQNNCRIISLSLGKTVANGEIADTQYEEIGHIALDKNCLIVAAAGNDSNRFTNRIAPVSIPANSSKIMAVGAIDRKLGLYVASNGGINPNGGGVDIAGPGVEVYSSKMSIRQYGTETGTSMATPHISGICALLMQANPAASAEQIWTKLIQTSKRLNIPSRDVGSGFAQITN